MSDLPDQTMPAGRWEFDEAVAEVFDDMLARSIPSYEAMREVVTDVATFYARRARPRTGLPWVVDLGTSRGRALLPLIQQLGTDQFRFMGVEVSPPMREAAIQLLGGNARVVDLDLRDDYPTADAAVTLAVLTLQFIPIEYRLQVLTRAYEQTLTGGALLLVEKVLGADAHADGMLVDRYLHLKAEHGYTQDQIAAKRRSLEGVLVPVTASWNQDLLRAAGFTHVECVWRHLNFAAWVAVRDN